MNTLRIDSFKSRKFPPTPENMPTLDQRNKNKSENYAQRIKVLAL